MAIETPFNKNIARRWLFNYIFAELKLSEKSDLQPLDNLLTFLVESRAKRDLAIQELKDVIVKNRDINPSILMLYLQKIEPLDEFIIELVTDCDTDLLQVIEQVIGDTRFKEILQKHDLEEKYSEAKDIRAIHHASRLVRQFTHGYGHIDKEGILLTCAQIRSRKSNYEFKPTVCGDIDELKSFLAVIRENADKLQGQNLKFIAQDNNHWVSGIIRVNTQGQAEVLLIDSTGYENRELNSQIICKAFLESFADIDFYFSPVKKQHSYKGCSVFSLDDAHHLHVVDRYLPAEYEGKGIFSYLADHTTDTKDPKDLDIDVVGKEVKYCKLPLSLMRNTQSSSLLREIVPDRDEREKQTAVDKRGTMPADFQEAYYETTAEQKQVSRTLQNKFRKHLEQNMTYLRTHSDIECEKEMEEFTVDTFSRQLSTKSN